MEDFAWLFGYIYQSKVSNYFSHRRYLLKIKVVILRKRIRSIKIKPWLQNGILVKVWYVSIIDKIYLYLKY